MNRRTLLVTPALLALTACASVPHLPPAAQMREAGSLASAHSFAAPAADFPATSWWTAYGDPALDRLVEEALAGSPSVAEAVARANAAGALQDEAHAALLPSLAVEANVGGIRPSQNQGFPPNLIPGDLRSNGRIAGNANWDIDLWGRNRAALTAATSQAQAAEIDVAQARLVLATAVVRGWSDLAEAFAARDIAAADVQFAQDNAALARQRVEAGIDNSSAEAIAVRKLADARGALAAADQAIGLDRNALAALLGAGPDRGMTIERPAAPATRALALPANLPLDLVGRRPDLASARLRAEAAAARIKAAHADFYPSVNLAAVVGLQSVGLDMLFKNSSLAANFGPALRLPIFDGGAIAARYTGARADYDLAVAQYNAALVTAYNETADAITRKRALADALAAARSRVSATEGLQAGARRRFDAGIDGRMTLLEVERSLLDARRQLALLEAEDRAADIALIRALGGGYRADAADTDGTNR